MVAPSKAYMDGLYRETVLAARRMSMAERLELSGALFDDLCERMRDGIRFQFPDAGSEQVEHVLGERLRLARRLEDRP